LTKKAQAKVKELRKKSGGRNWKSYQVINDSSGGAKYL
jgi:hypothetical protein